MSRPTQVWYADQRQTRPFVAALWAFLVKNKHTENAGNVLWPINLTMRRGLNKSPDHCWRAQLHTAKEKASIAGCPSLLQEQGWLPPRLFLIPLGVPVEYKREVTHKKRTSLFHFFFIVGAKGKLLFFLLGVKLNLADSTHIPENVFSACSLRTGWQF